jgi:hypothetical protein
MGAVETLAGVDNMWGKGRGGLEVHMNLMPPRVSKVSFFYSLNLLGGFLWKA